MNSRIIASIAVAGTLAYACGPRSRPSDPAVASIVGRADTHHSTATPTQPARRAERRNPAEVRVKIDARLDVQVAPEAVRLAFNLTNVGPKHVELSFHNGQSYDFVVVDSTGREVWRWGDGRLFTQTVRNKQLSKGETMSVAATVPQQIAPGRYTAIATLNSSNYPVEQRTGFVVGPVAVAAASR